ncbi:Embryogenesis-associated protein EMB8 [Bienertia sinuspersici]
MAFFTSTPITSNSYLFPPPTSLLLQSTFRNLENCLWLKKRRSKRKPKLRPPVRSNLQPSLPSVSFDLLSLLPPAALGFASALAISFSNRKSTDSELNSNPRVLILYVEDVSEKLVNEEKHFVWLDSGRIHVKNDGDGEVEERKNSGLLSFEYQRVCVSTDDGGVISLDWPSNLGLTEERGLDTTVLLIPGTPKGSMDDDVKCFVRDCLRQGLFPVVMNPRGCAGSPLTTARMFTAADSDDICSAIQYITRARPWSTLTGVGWGYGANMLTKYLAEAGEKTPLTAAICIDNPFDLDEATRTSPYCTRIDDKLTGGLIDILKSNKKLFQGRRKGFDVEKALSADSVRDFEKSISMVSHGFDTIEEFYTNSSTRSLVGKLKIPVLFVQFDEKEEIAGTSVVPTSCFQNDNGTVPLFSIPRGPIAENPFACLLLCSCLPSNVTATSWYQQVAIEVSDRDINYQMDGLWLTAVELGFLKGRHPLLQDIDVSINPSKGLALVEGRSSDMSGRHESDFSFAQLDSSDAYLDPMKQLLTDTDAQSKTDALSSISLKSNQSSAKNQALDDRFLSETNGSFPQDSSKSEDSTKDMETSEAEGDQGQVLPTAQVVMNMLDVTMPGTLKEEQKRKVLTAVGKGETLIKALEDAVPEDVRGKLTTSFELEEQRDCNLANSNNGKIVPSNSEAPGDDETSSCDNGQVDVDKLGEATGSQPPKTSARSDIPESKEVDSYDDDTSLTKALNESQNSDKKLDGDASAEMVGQLSDSGEDESEKLVIGPKMTKKARKRAISLGKFRSSRICLASKMTQEQLLIPNLLMHQKQHHPPSLETQQPEKQGDSKTKGAAADTIPADRNEAASPVSESQQSEKGDSKINKAAADTSEAAASLISETQTAFDALTGLDDSTQVAVNSVFGVLEDIIVQMEEKKIESTDNKGTENKDAINGTVTENDRSSSELQLEKQNDGEDKEDTIPLDMESVKGHDKNSPLYKDFLQKYILSEMQKMKHADVDSTTTPSLDNDPEDEHLLLLKQPGGMHVTVFDKSEKIERHSKLHPKESCMDNVIEPSYVILDKERQEEPVEELMEDVQDKLVSRDDILDSLELFVKTTLLNSLKVEVSRKLSSSDMENMEAPLAADMERVADAVYLAIQYDGKHNKKLLLSEFDPDFQEWSRLNGNRVTEAISEAVQNTSYLKKVLPIGVVVGSTLAALRNCFDLAVVYCNSVAGALAMDQGQNNVLKSKDPQQQQEIIQLPVDGIDHDPAENNLREAEGNIVLNALDEDDMEKVRSGNLNRDTLMVGAVTAALGASALLTNQQEDFMGNDSCETSEEKQMKSEPEDLADNKNQSNVVTSLAEKAMSVAAPVVPTREDGALDHDRVLGFSCMVLVLWSPVLLPLLPTLFHNMATHTSSRVVELACVFGLYSAVTILIIQWGKGIRGYEYPLKQYGLDFASSRKVRHLLIGFVGGIMLVVCIQSLNSLLGFVNFSFPLNLGSSSSNFSAKIKAYGQMFLLAGQGLLMAAGVAFVEELLFRSWLLEEIAADFGYHAGIFLSGLAFAVSQRSWQSIPGLWLLSLCLAGARLSKKGSLFIPIGLRTGLMASSYILQAGGFLVYLPKYPWWITGTQPFQPFNGVVGLLFALLFSNSPIPKAAWSKRKTSSNYSGMKLFHGSYA